MCQYQFFNFFFGHYLQWIAKAKSVSDGMEQTWHCIVDMKNKIIEMLDSDNDG